MTCSCRCIWTQTKIWPISYKIVQPCCQSLKSMIFFVVPAPHHALCLTPASETGSSIWKTDSPKLAAQPCSEYSCSDSMFSHSQDDLLSTNTNSCFYQPHQKLTQGKWQNWEERDTKESEDVGEKCVANVASSSAASATV